jgi:hypothetical protein
VGFQRRAYGAIFALKDLPGCILTTLPRIDHLAVDRNWQLSDQGVGKN